ncbi:hypothetical protein BH20BAC1_BH20BAC1_27860 [soil metagenome]
MIKKVNTAKIKKEISGEYLGHIRNGLFHKSWIQFDANITTNSDPSPSFVSTFISPPCAFIIS